MILVTGANGNIGSEVVKQLSIRGQAVRALVRDLEKAKGLAGPHVEIVEGDLDDVVALHRAMRGVDKLFLLTAASPRQVELQSNAIKAAQRAGVKLIVKQSEVHADPESPISLAKSHGLTELELKASGIPFTILRAGFFMQNLLMSAGSIAKQGAIFNCTGEGKIAAIDTRDVADVAVVVLTEPGHEGKTFVLTGPEALTFEEMASRLAEGTGKTVKYVDIPQEQMRAEMTTAGHPPWLVNDVLQFFAGLKVGSGERVTDVVATMTKRP
ncbi:MAG: SDR family oxidoreductase, partial [Polyangiaceae bacterium]